MEANKIFKLELSGSGYENESINIEFVTKGMSNEEISEGLINLFTDNKQLAPLFLAAIETVKLNNQKGSE